MWNADGGVQDGIHHGATDEFGYQADETTSMSTTCMPRCCTSEGWITRS